MAITSRADWDAAQRVRTKTVWTGLTRTIDGNKQFNDAACLVQEGTGNLTTGAVPAASALSSLPSGDWLMEYCEVGLTYRATTSNRDTAPRTIMVYEELYMAGPWVNPPAGQTKTLSGVDPSYLGAVVPEGNGKQLQWLAYLSSTGLTATTQTYMSAQAYADDGVSLNGPTSTITAHTSNQSNQYGVMFGGHSVGEGVGQLYSIGGGAYNITGTVSLIALRPLFEVSLLPGENKKKIWWDVTGMPLVRNTSALMVLAIGAGTEFPTYKAYFSNDTLSLNFSFVKA